MSNWTQKQITKWAIDTFGDPDDITDIIDRAGVEFDEMVDAAYNAKQGIEDYGHVIEEIADVFIILCQYCEHMGFDLQDAVDAKMDLNSTRSWIKTGNGVGQHI